MTKPAEHRVVVRRLQLAVYAARQNADLGVMFTVEISADAKAALETKLKECGFVRPGVMIVREGPKADVFRSKDGRTVWNIERPENPWSYQLRSFEQYPDAAIQIVNGIRVCLAVIPQEDEEGVVIRLRNGDPVIEPLGT